MPRARLEPERAAVVAACRRLSAAGMVPGTSGNVSTRAGDLVAVTPTGAALADLTPHMISVVDLGGQLVDGDLQPTSELELHLGIYRHYDAGAIVHTHAPASTAAACVLDELPCVHYQMLPLGGAVRVARYATFGSSDLAANVVEALAGRSAALMANHGAVTYAASVEQACEMMEVLEWACDVHQRALALGTPRTLDPAQLEAVIAAFAERGYGSTRPAARGDDGPEPSA